MELKIGARQVQEVTVLDVKGRIVYGTECNALRDHVKQLLADGTKKILLNLQEVSGSDSAGLGSLAGILISVRNQGGVLKLLHPTNRIRRVLESTALITVFEVFTDEQKALASFE